MKTPIEKFMGYRKMIQDTIHDLEHGLNMVWFGVKHNEDVDMGDFKALMDAASAASSHLANVAQDIEVEFMPMDQKQVDEVIAQERGK